MQETWFQILGQEDPPGAGNGNPLQYSFLENPWTEDGLQSMGLHRVGHDLETDMVMSVWLSN